MSETPRMRAPARALFVLTILMGSFLLFLVQPMVARMALPRLGGAPAVWNSAMLVYQALLLGGYAYAHALGRIRPRRQIAAHLALLLIAALWLPIGLSTAELPRGAQPALWVPWLLVISIGPLFFAISAQAPLIQRWFAEASGGQDPYRLYAASNLGSFAGLIAYPLLVEPMFPVRGQSLIWSVGYGLVVLLVAGCATLLPRTAREDHVAATSQPAGGRRVAYWIALALVPSGLMLATSTYITTDVVAMPLLWVLPLGLYLLSFSVAFAANRTFADLLTRIAPITILLFGGIIVGGYQARPYLNAALSLMLLFMAAVALHTALYRSRPAPDRLTGFYLAMSVGGALGGVFAALLAPLVFDWTYEYPILIVAAGLLVPQVFLTTGIRSIWQGDAVRARIAMMVVLFVVALLVLLRLVGPSALFGEHRQGPIFVVIAAVGLLTIGARLPYVTMLLASLALFGGFNAVALSFKPDARTRSYFGVYTVSETPRQRELAHGTTVHGVQLTGSIARERTPTTYYALGSGVGQAMTMAEPLFGTGARIGVVGLGTGTLACYARPGQHWTFYEIDPAVVRIARDNGQFTFLRRCLPSPRIVLGDARLSLSAEPDASFDILALDAFSSDAVPMHLLTTEAFATYGRVVSPRGIVMVHISNRFIDLRPVVAAAARAGGWRALRILSRPSSLDEGASMAEWIALTRDRETATVLYTLGNDWQPLRRYPRFTPWTDDYSSILPLIDAP